MSGSRLRRAKRPLGTVLAVSGLLAILGLTLHPSPKQVQAVTLTPLHCLVCGESGGADVFLNLLLFVPMAAGLRLLGRPWLRVVAISAMLSLAVESLQYFVVAGRDASLSDLLTNTAGGALGAGLASRLDLLLAPASHVARGLAIGAAAAWLAVLAFSAFAMRPWAPDQPLWSYCTAGYPTSEIFAGTTRSVTLNGVRLPCDGAIGASASIGESLRKGAVTLDVAALSSDPGLGQRVLHVVRAPHATLVMVAQHGRSVRFRAPAAAQRLRLHSPLVRLSEAFPERAGVPVDLHAKVQGRRLQVSAAYQGGRRSMELALSPAHGWTMVLPAGIEPGAPLRLAAALWLGGLLIPAAYWAGFTGGPRRALGALVLVASVGLGAIPPLAGYAPAHWSEWLGAAGGIAAGWALCRFGTYLQSRCGSPSISAYSSS